MKIWKTKILIIGIMAMLFFSITASAETESDNQGDVWHFVYPYWQEQTVSNQPNIDIKEISAEIIENQITLSIKLWPGGTFSRGIYDKIGYIMFYNTSDAYYMMSYTDIIGTEPIGGAMGISLDGSYMPSSGEVVVNGDTLSVTMNKVGDDTTSVELYGTSWMFEDYGAEQYIKDQWHDFVGDYSWNPETEPEDDSQEDDETQNNEIDDSNDDKSDDDSNNQSKKTPGFEAFALIIAIGIIYVIMRKKA